MPSALLDFGAILVLPLLWTILVLASVAAGPVYLLRWVIGQLARVVNPSCVMVTGGDVLFAQDPHNPNSKPHSVLLGYTTVEGGLTLEEFRVKYLQEVVLSKNPFTGKLNYPKYQQYFRRWCGYSFWVWEKSFSIENHIRLFQTKSVLDKDQTLREDDLLTLLGPLSNQPFAPGQSPWEYLYVPSYLPKDGAKPVVLVIMRMHHSIGDGYSILKSFISYACGEGANHKLLVNPSSKTDRKHASACTQKHLNVNKLVKILQSNLIRLSHIFYQFLTIPVCLLKHMVTIDRSPWFHPRSKLTQICHLGLTRRIPVADIKRLSHQKGVSFSAILFSAVGGGIRRFCVKEGLKENSIPQEIQCFTPFPRSGHPDNTLVNHFTTAVIKIFPGEASSEERLQQNEVDLSQVKTSTFPMTMIWIMSMLSCFPTWYVHLVGANWFASAILSSFPGPREICSYFKRYPVPDIVFWTPHLNGNAGIGISMLTYGNSLRFALNVDSAIISSQVKVQELCSCIEEEINSLMPPPPALTVKSDGHLNKIGEIESSYAATLAQLRLRSVS